MGDILAQLGWGPFQPGVDKHQKCVPGKGLRKSPIQSHQVTQVRHQTGPQNKELN